MGRLKWNTVGRIIQKRERAGKGSVVFIRGARISPDKVQREMSRNVALTLRSKFGAGPASPSPEPPDGVDICTPGASYRDVFWDGGASPWTQFVASLRGSGTYGMYSISNLY